MRISFLVALLCCGGAGRPAVERSAVSCGPCEARADGFARVRVRVLLRDAGGARIRGARVLLGGVAAMTDDEGVAAATFSSLQAGPREVQVRLADGSGLGAVAVEFFAGSFPRVDFPAP